jgi:hypothetical protein
VQIARSPQSSSAVQLVGTQAALLSQNDPVAQIPRGSMSPAGTCSQVPIAPARLQVRQGPVQALLQQVPSTQKPVKHSEPVVQTPVTSPSWQVLLTQGRPFVQSAGPLQLDLHVPRSTSQTYGAQMKWCGPQICAPASPVAAS